MVLQGHILMSSPIDLPSFSKLSKIGRSFSFGPAYCSSTYCAADFRYASGESSSPLPSARSAIHHALFVPSLCLVFSHSRRDFSSFGPSFFTSASHSSSERPVLLFNSATHFCTMPTPGCTS